MDSKCCLGLSAICTSWSESIVDDLWWLDHVTRSRHLAQHLGKKQHTSHLIFSTWSAALCDLLWWHEVWGRETISDFDRSRSGVARTGGVRPRRSRSERPRLDWRCGIWLRLAAESRCLRKLSHSMLLIWKKPLLFTFFHIHAFGRDFCPKRLTVDSRYKFLWCVFYRIEPINFCCWQYSLPVELRELLYYFMHSIIGGSLLMIY